LPIVGENIQVKKFAPVGRCIYCGADGGIDGLRSEHIIPLSLGGKAELPEASCASCEAITSYIDGYLARGTFYDLRLSVPKLATRRPKERPKTRAAHFEFADHEERREFTTGAHPFFTVLPVWGLPGILRDAQPCSEFPPSRALSFTYASPDLGELLCLEASETARMKSEISLNLGTFGRAIAKIAYCNAVASYGLNGFRALVMPDLILGKYPCISHFVGSRIGDPPPPSRRDLLHSVGFRDAVYGRQKLIVAEVRLFANSGTPEHGMPIYCVVVGAPLGTQNAAAG